MYATVHNNHYRKVIEQPRDFYTFNTLHIAHSEAFSKTLFLLRQIVALASL